jgi:hypothetical protein
LVVVVFVCGVVFVAVWVVVVGVLRAAVRFVRCGGLLLLLLLLCVDVWWARRVWVGLVVGAADVL